MYGAKGVEKIFIDEVPTVKVVFQLCYICVGDGKKFLNVTSKTTECWRCLGLGYIYRNEVR